MVSITKEIIKTRISIKLISSNLLPKVQMKGQQSLSYPCSSHYIRINFRESVCRCYTSGK